MVYNLLVKMSLTRKQVGIEGMEHCCTMSMGVLFADKGLAMGAKSGGTPRLLPSPRASLQWLVCLLPCISHVL